MLALQLTAELTGYVTPPPPPARTGPRRRVTDRPTSRVRVCAGSVTDLRPSDVDGDPFYYMFKVACTSCREVHENWVGVTRFVRLSLSAPPLSLLPR